MSSDVIQNLCCKYRYAAIRCYTLDLKICLLRIDLVLDNYSKSNHPLRDVSHPISFDIIPLLYCCASLSGSACGFGACEHVHDSVIQNLVRDLMRHILVLTLHCNAMFLCILLVKLGCCFSQIYELQNGNETVGDVTSNLCCKRWNHTAILPTHTPAGMRALLHLWVCPPSYSPARLDPNINSGPVQLFPAVMRQQFASWRLSRKSKLNRLISRKLTVENETMRADNK